MANIPTNKEQDEAHGRIFESHHLFITGQAGTGKTQTIKYVSEDMFNSSFNLLKFSPLRTPDVRKAKAFIRKQSGEDGYVSSSSVASSVTNDIVSISQSIQEKLSAEDDDSGSLKSSEEETDLFITQKFSDQPSKSEKEGGYSKSKKKVTEHPHKSKSNIKAASINVLSDANNNSPVKEASKPKMKLSAKLKHGKNTKAKGTQGISLDMEAAKQDSSPLSDESSDVENCRTTEEKSTALKSDLADNKKSPQKKVSNKNELNKDNKGKKQAVSSSSDVDSDSSSESEVDEAKCRSIMERMRAKTIELDSSDLASENESPNGQKIGRTKRESPTKVGSPANFSQDLFSPKLKGNSSGALKGSGMSPTKQQNSRQKSDKGDIGKTGKHADKQTQQLKHPKLQVSQADSERSESHSDDSGNEAKEHSYTNMPANEPNKEIDTHDFSSSASDSDDRPSSLGNNHVEKSKRAKTANTANSQSGMDSGSDSSDGAQGSKKAARCSDSGSESESENDHGKKLRHTASPKNSSSKSADKESDTDIKSQKQCHITSAKSKASGSKDNTDTVSENLDVSSSKSSGSGSESDSDNNVDTAAVRSEKRGTIFNSPNPDKVTRQTGRSDTPVHSMRQTKITDHCLSDVSAAQPFKKTSAANRRKMRYKPPEGFDIDENTEKYVTHSEVKDKQIWLIQTPVDFDVRTLGNKEIQLDGMQTICAKGKSEKQYEVVCRPKQENQDLGYCSVVYDEGGNPMLGDGISGQIQVLDWIPGIPPVEIDIPTKGKHEIPDDLKLRYVPFGSKSPERLEDPTVHGTKRKHYRSEEEVKKKKKKKKDKKEK